MANSVPGGTLRLADDLVLSRMGFGAMQLSRARRLRPAPGPRPGPRGPARSRRQRRHPHRHQRLLRPGHRQRADQGGAPPLPGGPAHRHQGRRPPRRRWQLAPFAGPRRPQGPGPGEPRAPRRGRPRRRQPPPSGDGTGEESVAEPFGALAELQKEGLIRHLGLSEASDTQLTEAQAIAPVVTVQNLYNVANRRDDAMVDRCAAEGIAYAAYFPLGGFTPLQSATLDRVAARLGASPHAGRAGLAAAALAHDGPHPRHLVPGPPPREHRGGRPGPAARGGRRTRHHRPLTRPRA